MNHSGFYKSRRSLLGAPNGEVVISFIKYPQILDQGPSNSQYSQSIILAIKITALFIFLMLFAVIAFTLRISEKIDETSESKIIQN